VSINPVQWILGIPYKDNERKIVRSYFLLNLIKDSNFSLDDVIIIHKIFIFVT